MVWLNTFLLLLSSMLLSTVVKADSVQLELSGQSYSITAYETNETAREFYDSNNSVAGISEFAFDYNSTGIKDAITLFAHKEIATGILSFGIIFDSLNDGSSGSFNGTLLAPNSSLVVSDDPGEITTNNADGYNLKFSWNKSKADGFMISMNEPNSFYGVLSSNAFSNIENIMLADAKSASLLNAGIYSGQQINIASAVSEPASYIMFVSGLMMISFFKARRRLANHC